MVVDPTKNGAALNRLVETSYVNREAILAILHLIFFSARVQRNLTNPEDYLTQETTGSQTDEECDGDHWSEASVRLANLEAKMDKMLDLFPEIAALKGSSKNHRR